MEWKGVLQEMTTIKSRFCVRCDAVFKFQCSCPNHKVAAWQRNEIFHMGKRYRGKQAWDEVHPDQEYKKSE